MIKPANKIHEPVCGIFAVFLASPSLTEFEDARSLAKHSLGRSGNWKGWMYWSELKQLFTAIGLGYVEQFGPAAGIGETLGKAFKAARFAVRDRQYVVRAGKHFMTIRNGRIYDQFNPEGVAVSEHLCRRRKITHIFYVK